MTSHLIEPHGGSLVNLIVSGERAAELKVRLKEMPAWDLTPRQICDVELLLNGGFSPLTGFLGREDCERVCSEMRLADGTLWPVPVTLDVSEETAATLTPGSQLALRDLEGMTLAVLKVQQIWRPDLEQEARQVFGTDSPDHPGVDYLLNVSHKWYVGGSLEGLQLPHHYDFVQYRFTPSQLRRRFSDLGWRKVVAFQTRNPLHRAHQELTFRAAREQQANLLIHPVVGLTKPGDVDHCTRVRCYQAVLKYYPYNTTMLSLLPLAMRMGGPREAILHAIIRKNYGCTHLIVGRDHAGPGSDSRGRPFYGPYEAQEVLREYESELGIRMVPFQMMVYVKERGEYLAEDELPKGVEVCNLSGTDLRKRLTNGLDIPDWFSFPEVIAELRRSYPPRSRQGFTIFFTGLSGSGKSTIANVLLVKLMEMGGRPITLLDGDIVRKNLSSELGFSKEHRDLNIVRIGFVASEIAKNGGIAICAPIAPYDTIRKKVRQAVESKGGGFILVHVATPLEVCELRDRKGLYAKARSGIIKQFTGISDPYEEPRDAEIVLDTTELTPEECSQQIILALEKEGYVGPDGSS
ncbi:MAG: bifunctional sulfate adenylyltransferase/adenylylsulfate kinase [Candidatus Glassbacteria bacterium]